MTGRKIMARRLTYGTVGLLGLMMVAMLWTISGVGQQAPRTAVSDSDDGGPGSAETALLPMTADEAAQAVMQANAPVVLPPPAGDGPVRSDAGISGAKDLHANGGVHRP